VQDELNADEGGIVYVFVEGEQDAVAGSASAALVKQLADDSVREQGVFFGDEAAVGQSCESADSPQDVSAPCIGCFSPRERHHPGVLVINEIARRAGKTYGVDGFH